MRASSSNTFRNSSDCARFVSASFAKVLAALEDVADFHAAIAEAIAANSEQTEMAKFIEFIAHPVIHEVDRAGVLDWS